MCAWVRGCRTDVLLRRLRRKNCLTGACHMSKGVCSWEVWTPGAHFKKGSLFPSPNDPFQVNSTLEKPHPWDRSESAGSSLTPRFPCFHFLSLRPTSSHSFPAAFRSSWNNRGSLFPNSLNSERVTPIKYLAESVLVSFSKTVLITCYNMNEPWKHDAVWKQTRKTTCCKTVCTKCPQQAIHRQKSRFVVARGCRTRGWGATAEEYGVFFLGCGNVLELDCNHLVNIIKSSEL